MDTTEVARRLIEEIFVAGRADAIERLVTPGFVSHGLPGSGPDVLRGALERTGMGLSDPEMTILDTVSEGDRVAIRLRSSATQSGPFLGLPPSGRRFTIEEIHLFRIDGGRVAEHWHQMDTFDLLRQLGASIKPAEAPERKEAGHEGVADQPGSRPDGAR